MQARRHCQGWGWNGGGGLPRVAFALRLPHRLGYFLREQRNAVGAMISCRRVGGSDLSPRTRVDGLTWIASWLLIVVMCLWCTPSCVAQAAATYAFANASPIRVYNRPASSGGRNENFEFGKAYEVDQQAPGYVTKPLPIGSDTVTNTIEIPCVSRARAAVTGVV